MSSSKAIVPELGRSCQKFQENYRSFKDSDKEAILYLKLRKEGCPRKIALNFSAKNVCRSDSTRTIFGPSGFRILKVQKQLEHNCINLGNGWCEGCHEYAMPNDYLQSIEKLQLTESDPLRNIFDADEDEAKQEFKRILLIMKQYFQDIQNILPPSSSHQEFLQNIKNIQIKTRNQLTQPQYFELNSIKFFMLADALKKMREEEKEDIQKNAIPGHINEQIEGLINKFNVFEEVLRQPDIKDIPIEVEKPEEAYFLSPKLLQPYRYSTPSPLFQDSLSQASSPQSPQSSQMSQSYFKMSVFSDYPKETESTQKSNSQSSPSNIYNTSLRKEILLLSPLSPNTFNEEEPTIEQLPCNSKNISLEVDKSLETAPKIKIIEDNFNNSGLIQRRGLMGLSLDRLKKASVIESAVMQLQLLQDMDMTNQDLFASTPMVSSKAGQRQERLSCISLSNQRLLEEQFNQSQYLFKKAISNNNKNYQSNQSQNNSSNNTKAEKKEINEENNTDSNQHQEVSRFGNLLGIEGQVEGIFNYLQQTQQKQQDNMHKLSKQDKDKGYQQTEQQLAMLSSSGMKASKFQNSISSNLHNKTKLLGNESENLSRLLQLQNSQLNTFIKRNYHHNKSNTSNRAKVNTSHLLFSPSSSKLAEQNQSLLKTNNKLSQQRSQQQSPNNKYAISHKLSSFLSLKDNSTQQKSLSTKNALQLNPQCAQKLQILTRNRGNSCQSIISDNYIKPMESILNISSSGCVSSNISNEMKPNFNNSIRNRIFKVNNNYKNELSSFSFKQKSEQPLQIKTNLAERTNQQHKDSSTQIEVRQKPQSSSSSFRTASFQMASKQDPNYQTTKNRINSCRDKSQILNSISLASPPFSLTNNYYNISSDQQTQDSISFNQKVKKNPLEKFFKRSQQS